MAATRKNRVDPKALTGTTVDRQLNVNALHAASNILRSIRTLKHVTTRLDNPEDIIIKTQAMDIVIVKNITFDISIRLQILSRLILSQDDLEFLPTVSVILSALRSVFSFVESTPFIGSLKAAGFSLEITDNLENLLDMLVPNHPNIKRDLEDYVATAMRNNPTAVGLGCIGMILVATGKLINNTNRNSWDEKRFKAFGGTLGYTMNDLIPFHISINACNQLNNLLTMIISMRRDILRDVKNAAENSPIGLVKKLSEVVLTNLKWYQMGNLYLITEVLLKNHTYLLLWGRVARLIVDYELAVKNFRTYGDWFPYSKYMNQQLDSSIYNSDGIQELAAICKVVAIKNGHSSFANFNTGYKGEVDETKIHALYELANCGNFEWADFIKESILPTGEENKGFYEAIYSNNEIDAVEQDVHDN